MKNKEASIVLVVVISFLAIGTYFYDLREFDKIKRNKIMFNKRKTIIVNKMRVDHGVVYFNDSMLVFNNGFRDVSSLCKLDFESEKTFLKKQLMEFKVPFLYVIKDGTMTVIKGDIESELTDKSRSYLNARIDKKSIWEELLGK